MRKSLIGIVLLALVLSPTQSQTAEQVGYAIAGGSAGFIPHFMSSVGNNGCSISAIQLGVSTWELMQFNGKDLASNARWQEYIFAIFNSAVWIGYYLGNVMSCFVYPFNYGFRASLVRFDGMYTSPTLTPMFKGYHLYQWLILGYYLWEGFDAYYFEGNPDYFEFTYFIGKSAAQLFYAIGSLSATI